MTDARGPGCASARGLSSFLGGPVRARRAPDAERARDLSPARAAEFDRACNKREKVGSGRIGRGYAAGIMPPTAGGAKIAHSSARYVSVKITGVTTRTTRVHFALATT